MSTPRQILAAIFDMDGLLINFRTFMGSSRTQCDGKPGGDFPVTSCRTPRFTHRYGGQNVVHPAISEIGQAVRK